MDMQAYNTEIIVMKEEVQKSLETESMACHAIPYGEVPGLVSRQKGPREDMTKSLYFVLYRKE